jgi:hypothetical protein
LTDLGLCRTFVYFYDHDCGLMGWDGTVKKKTFVCLFLVSSLFIVHFLVFLLGMTRFVYASPSIWLETGFMLQCSLRPLSRVNYFPVIIGQTTPIFLHFTEELHD